MNLKLKRAVVGGLLAMSVFAIAGCGTQEKAGVIDYTKVTQESNKAKEIQTKLEAKFAEINNRLVEQQQSQTGEEFTQTQAKAKEEFTVYQQAMANEFTNEVNAKVQAIAKEKKLTIVVNKDAVYSEAEDITDEVIKKMNESTPAPTATASQTTTTEAKAASNTESQK